MNDRIRKTIGNFSSKKVYFLECEVEEPSNGADLAPEFLYDLICKKDKQK